MALKRKFVVDDDLDAHDTVKHLRLVPFPNYEPDTDAVMFDSDYSPPSHSRLPSLVSSSSSSSDSPTSPESSPFTPFDKLPLPFFNSDGIVDPKSHVFSNYSTQSSPSQVPRLFQPSSDFFYHGTSCSQIPKLRLSCSPGADGRRAMWSHCEQCGAISMVETAD